MYDLRCSNPLLFFFHWVAGLTYDTNEVALKEAFSWHGDVVQGSSDLPVLASWCWTCSLGELIRDYPVNVDSESDKPSFDGEIQRVQLRQVIFRAWIMLD